MRFLPRIGMRFLFAAQLVVGIVVVPASVSHATKFWKNGVLNGNWSTSNNWSAVSQAGADNGGVPVAGEHVVITHNGGAARTVTLDTSTPSLGFVYLDLTGGATDTLSITGNQTLTVAGIGVGGNNGFVFTNGRGAVDQSNGTVTVGPGFDFILGWNSGSSGTYNLSVNGQLLSNIPVYVGYQGSGTFTQTGGTAHYFSSLNLANAAGSTGSYSLTNGSAIVDGNAYVGGSAAGTGGSGTLTIGGGGSMTVAGQLKYFNGDSVQILGGNLTVGSLTDEAGDFVFFSGTLRVTGPSGITISTNANPDLQTMNIGANQTLIVDNNINITTAGSSLGILGGTVTAGGFVITPGTSINHSAGVLNITGAGGLPISNSPNNPFGSSISPVEISELKTINVTNTTTVANGRTLQLKGGTLTTRSLSVADGTFEFNRGTLGITGPSGLQISPGGPLRGSFTIDPEKTINVTNQTFIDAGDHLTLDGGTLRSGSLTVNGSFHFVRGLLEPTGGTITGLTSLTVPTSGEFRATGVQSLRVTGAAGSIITATGSLTLGNASAVNGFGTQGTLQVGANTVALLDANDVVFDSLSLVTLGSGASFGTVNAVNGLTLDFGGNITGYGTVFTPNNITKPLINNGHITGNSAAQRITLPGYVKGVGTFDNVNVTGTFSPGLSPTILSVGNVTFSPSSTLIMELGGTSPGSGYDQLQSTGAIVLGGTLQISLINGFVPAAGQTFDLFDSATLSGTFSSVVLPSVPGMTWDTSQLASGMLSAVPGLSGDYNNNGTVDAADYVVWRKTDGTQAGYNLWRSHFGQTPGSGAGQSDFESPSAVPEPNLAVLFVVCAPLLLRRWTR